MTFSKTSAVLAAYLALCLGAGTASADGPLALDLDKHEELTTPDEREAAREEDRKAYFLAKAEYEREVGKLEDEQVRELEKAEEEYFRELDKAAEEYEREAAKESNADKAFEKYEAKVMKMSERFEEKAARIDAKFVEGVEKQRSKLDP